MRYDCLLCDTIFSIFVLDSKGANLPVFTGFLITVPYSTEWDLDWNFDLDLDLTSIANAKIRYLDLTKLLWKSRSRFVKVRKAWLSRLSWLKIHSNTQTLLPGINMKWNYATILDYRILLGLRFCTESESIFNRIDF